jgi:uncharacterized protein (TIGR02001 family)
MRNFKWLAAILGLCAMHSALAAEAAPPVGGAGGVGSEIELASEEASPFTANVSLVNNYLYRGITQTGGKPAVQGGFDYEHSSGLYAGVFGTNSSFFNNLYLDRAGTEGAINSSMELDMYFGFKNHIATDFNYDVGFLRYNFPGDYAAGATRGDTNELYLGFGYKWISAKYSYSLGNTFGVKDARGTNYLEVNANVPIVEGLTLGLHAGKQTFKGATADALTAAGATPTYTDYKVGLTKEIEDYEIAVAYSKTNAKTGPGSFYYILGRDLGRGAAIVSLTRTF